MQTRSEKIKSAEEIAVEDIREFLESDSSLEDFQRLLVNVLYEFPKSTQISIQLRALKVKSSQRPHLTAYYNPTTHTVRVSSLGLTRPMGENDKIVESVPPGGLVHVPSHLTLGGARSVLAQTAPQLIPAEHRDSRRLNMSQMVISLQPLTEIEWWSTTRFEATKCCMRPPVWSTRIARVICSRCEKLI